MGVKAGRKVSENVEYNFLARDFLFLFSFRDNSLPSNVRSSSLQLKRKREREIKIKKKNIKKIHKKKREKGKICRRIIQLGYFRVSSGFVHLIISMQNRDIFFFPPPLFAVRGRKIVIRRGVTRFYSSPLLSLPRSGSLAVEN